LSRKERHAKPAAQLVPLSAGAELANLGRWDGKICIPGAKGEEAEGEELLYRVAQA
jgi:hypothetical protein